MIDRLNSVKIATVEAAGAGAIHSVFGKDVV
jgi:hypothetical protein